MEVWQRGVGRRGFLVGASGLLLAVAGCAGLAPGAPGAMGNQPKEKVRILVASSVMYAPYSPYAVAQELGYFAEEGLNPELVLVPGSTDVAKQIGAGSGDVGVPSPEPVIIGRQDGSLKLKFFYSFYNTNIYSLAVTADSPIQSPSELRGKRIGVTSMGSGAVPMGKALLSVAGLDPEKDVTFVAIGEAAQAAAAIRNKQVDALSMWDAQYALIEVADPTVKIRQFPNDAVAAYPSNSMVARDDYIQKYPKRLVGIGRATAKGTVFALENPRAAIQLMWKQYPDSKPAGKDEATALQEALKVFDARKPRWLLDSKAIKKWGYCDPAAFGGMGDFLLQQGLIKTKVPVEEYITNQFVDEMNNFDEAKIREQARNWKPS